MLRKPRFYSCTSRYATKHKPSMAVGSPKNNIFRWKLNNLNKLFLKSLSKRDLPTSLTETSLRDFVGLMSGTVLCAK